MGLSVPPWSPSFGSGAPGAGVNPAGPYFDTSTTPYTMYVFTAGAWHATGSGSLVPGSPSIVQAVAFPQASSVTLTGTPAKGNLLLGLVTSNGAQTAGAGWNKFGADIVVNTNHYGVYAKISLNGNKTQSPTSGAASFGCMSVTELSGYSGQVIDVVGANETTNGTTVSTNVTTTAVNELLVGMSNFFTNTISGFMVPVAPSVLVVQSPVGNREGIVLSQPAAAIGTFTMAATSAINVDFGMLVAAIR